VKRQQTKKGKGVLKEDI